VDQEEALQVAADKAAVLRTWSYDDLVETLLDEQETGEVTASSGATYQLEALAHWDGAKGGDLRVMVCADDMGRSALRPVALSFIMAPDGTFVDDD
jgi:hypothetical protein